MQQEAAFAFLAADRLARIERPGFIAKIGQPLEDRARIERWTGDRQLAGGKVEPGRGDAGKAYQSALNLGDAVGAMGAAHQDLEGFSPRRRAQILAHIVRKGRANTGQA